MTKFLIASILSGLVLIAGTISIEFGIASAIIEMMFAVIAGNFFHIKPTPWLTFITSFGGILLTFLTGTEVNLKLMKEKFK